MNEGRPESWNLLKMDIVWFPLPFQDSAAQHQGLLLMCSAIPHPDEARACRMILSG